MTNWVVVGPGAVASVVAARLVEQQQPVFCANRSGEPHELRVTGHTKHQSVLPNINEQPHCVAGASWFIAVKAWQLQSVLSQFSAPLSHVGVVILSHNGFIHDPLTAPSFPADRCFDWVTTHGSYRQNGTVVHSGLGESWLGLRQPAQQPTEQWPSAPNCHAMLAQAIAPVYWDSNIVQRRWHKLAVNCAINAIASLANKPNGVVLEAEHRSTVAGVCREVAAIMVAELQLAVAPQALAESMCLQALKVAEDTAQNTKSMLQDLRNQQPTEIDYLNGFVHKKGQHLQVPTPFNTALYQRVKTLENKGFSLP